MINVYRFDDNMDPDVTIKDGEHVSMENPILNPPQSISTPGKFDFIIVFVNDVHYFKL